MHHLRVGWVPPEPFTAFTYSLLQVPCDSPPSWVAAAESLRDASRP